jgi:hypothetical protein
MYYFQTKANVKCPKDFTRHTSMFVSTLKKVCGHILYLSVSSTMPYGKRTLDKTQQPPLMGSPRQQTPGGGGKMTAVSPPLEHVFLRHVYFMNNKSKYVSVGVFIPLATTSTVWNLARPGERRWY